ncbi:carboxypeptidase regulatory-like domain-containing protein [Variovorax paradoxus]|nr:carboxypeptidase regulatory-like domain-containing protein [Variovorax paradoxus]
MRTTSFQSPFLRAVFACACTAAPWIAQAQIAAPMPAMRTEGAVQYMCGGIGSDESTAMRAAMKDHPLSLLFARADGAYLAEVAVTIRDAKGATALAVRASGPVCLINLPAGRYTIEAASEGVAKKQDVTIGGGPKTADFRF